jgi:hypothetical protein
MDAVNIVAFPSSPERVWRESAEGYRKMLAANGCGHLAIEMILADLKPRILRICARCKDLNLPSKAVLSREDLQQFVTSNMCIAINELLGLQLELFEAKRGAG